MFGSDLLITTSYQVLEIVKPTPNINHCSRAGDNSVLGIHPRKLTYWLKNPPFEDVFPIENGDFPKSC